MEDQSLKEMWKAYEQKLEKSLAINLQIVRSLQVERAESNLRSFQRSQVIGVLLGIASVLFLGFLIYVLQDNLFFSLSAGMILLFNVVAIGTYIRNAAIVDQINISENIAKTQAKLANVESTMTQVGRLMILQTPFFCTFFLSDQLVVHGGAIFWTVEITVTSFFIFLSVWAYRSLTYQNIDKKWVRIVLDGFGAKSVRRAMEFLKELEEFKKE